jgi:hypothetical protein
MATWEAKCWLGSSVGFQTLQVKANTFSGAEQQLKHIYGAKQIINLRQVSHTDGMITSDMPSGTAASVLIENMFNLITILFTLLFKGIALLYQFLQNSRKGR